MTANIAYNRPRAKKQKKVVGLLKEGALLAISTNLWTRVR